MNSDEDYTLLLNDEFIMSRNQHSYNSGEYRFGAPFDFATPAIRVRFPNGAETLRLIYQSHEITQDSLNITVVDSFYPFEVKLIYQFFGDLPIISRSAVITNNTDGKIILRSAMSATLQLPCGKDYRLTYFAGDWGAEYQRQSHMITQSKTVLETSYLTDAAAHCVPFFALDEGGYATETYGEVYFGALQYSGDFKITVESHHTQHVNRTGVTLG